MKVNNKDLKQENNYHQGRKPIFDQAHPILLKIIKDEKVTYLIYISLQHIDQMTRHIDHLPHTQLKISTKNETKKPI